MPEAQENAALDAATQRVLGDIAAHPRLRVRRLLIWVVGIALMVAAAYFWLDRSGDNVAQTYRTEAATRGDLIVVVTATGSVQPSNKVDVSSELSGVVRKVFVDYNSLVKVGDVLAELDTDKLKATVDSSRAHMASAKAKVADAEATLEEKKAEFERKKGLAARQVASVQDLDAAKAAFDRASAGLISAKADVGVAEAQLNLDITNLSKARIVSPINGIVLKRNVDPGQTVASSLQAPVLFSLADDLKRMELQVDIDEADVGMVAEGQVAAFAVDAYPSRRFPAQIRMLRYGSEIVQGVVTYKAVLTIDNAELLLRPGMTATATITVENVKDALLVPNGALRYSPATRAAADNRSFFERLMPGRPGNRPVTPNDAAGRNRQVWVLRDGAPVPVRVVVGSTDGRRTVIAQGNLKAGDKVIVDSVSAGR